MTNGTAILERHEAIIRSLNIMDDDFFHKIIEDEETSEEILQVMLDDPEIHIVNSTAQKFLRNCGSRSVILDALCTGGDGRYFCIEMQKSDDDDHQRRVRYNSSNLDTLITEKGTSFSEIPDVYSVYLMDSDLFHGGYTAYHVNRVVEETGEIANNGFHELYVNASVDDGSLRAGLMQYMKHTVGEDSRFPHTSNRVKYFKESQRGGIEMNALLEAYLQERSAEVAAEVTKKVTAEVTAATLLRESETRKKMFKESAGNFFRNNISMQIVEAGIPSLTHAELLEIYREVTGKEFQEELPA